MRVFTSLREALRQGFYVYDTTRDREGNPTGYLMVTNTSHGLARALVDLTTH